MLNSTIEIKIKQRLNKLDSQDYDNIECWQIVEAFNKAQVEWARRQLHGINIVKEGDEGSTRRKDDLQVLLSTQTLDLTNKEYYYFGKLPIEYLQWKRVDVYAKKDCCDKKRINVYLAEEGNLNELLRDKAKQPSFEWGETFATVQSDKFRIYTNGEFDLSTPKLVYYRKPRNISFLGCINPSTGTADVDVECELKDDIIEMVIDEACSILAGDMELFNQYSRTKQQATLNN